MGKSLFTRAHTDIYNLISSLWDNLSNTWWPATMYQHNKLETPKKTTIEHEKSNSSPILKSPNQNIGLEIRNSKPKF